MEKVRVGGHVRTCIRQKYVPTELIAAYAGVRVVKHCWKMLGKPAWSLFFGISPIANELAQRYLRQHQIRGVLLDPGGNHGAMDQRKHGLRCDHALLRPKAKPCQVLGIKSLPILVDLLASGLNLRVQVD